MQNKPKQEFCSKCGEPILEEDISWKNKKTYCQRCYTKKEGRLFKFWERWRKYD